MKRLDDSPKRFGNLHNVLHCAFETETMQEQWKPIFTLIITQSGQGRSMRSIALLLFPVKAERQYNVRPNITEERNSSIRAARERNTLLPYHFILLLAYARETVLFK